MKIPGRINISLKGQKGSSLDMARGRLTILSLFFIIAYIIVVGKIVDLTLIQGELKKDESTVSYLEAEPEKEKIAGRADIVDRNGVILARSLKTASLYADPKYIPDPKTLVRDLVKIFPDLSYGDTLQKLQSDKRFVWIKRNITPDEQYKILYLGHPGLSFKEEQRRLYPQGNLAAHVVGYTSVDGHGLAGLEAGFDKLLLKSEDALVTTIDVRFQHALRREVAGAVRKFGAVAGTGAIMDVNTGEILAAVSLPDFDPHKVSDKNKDALFNRLTLGVFEPGSTFKIFTTAAAIELGGAKMGQTYDAREPIKFQRFKISDYHAQKRIMTLPEVFMHSSNIGSIRMAQAVGAKDFKNFLNDLGLLRAPSLEIPEIGAPLMPQKWSELDLMTAAFGHGLAVSPLQLVSASASIMNGGLLVRPTLVLDKTLSERGRKKDVRVVSEKTAHRMRQLMRLVVTGGTGGKADVPGYNVGGKTGTADKNSGKGYDKDKRRSSFMAFFPVEEPRYAIYIMVDEPKGIKESYGYATAGWVAAPAVKNVIQSIVAIEGIKPRENDELAHTLDGYVKSKEEIAKEKQLASFSDH
jgi:cell division protein FtsI (penicillin-binding protein 3)